MHVVKRQIGSTVALGHATFTLFVHALSTHFLVERLADDEALRRFDEFRIQGEVEARRKPNGAEHLTKPRGESHKK